MRKLLLVADDANSRKTISQTLGREFTLTSVASVQAAIDQLVTESYDLLIIDQTLPDGIGVEVCEYAVHSEAAEPPAIIFLTQKYENTDRLTELYVSGDDYLVKPLRPVELRAMVTAKLQQKQSSFQVENLVVDFDDQRVFHIENGLRTEIELTTIEFRLLSALLQRIDVAVPHEILLEKVWADEVVANERMVENHITHLRKKIRPAGIDIRSVYLEGYKITPVRSAILNAA